MNEKIKKSLLIIFSLLVVWLSWGSSYAIVKIIVGSISPWPATCIKFFLGGLILLIIARTRGEHLPYQRLEWQHIFIIATTQMLLSAGMNYFIAPHVMIAQRALFNASDSLIIPILSSTGNNSQKLSLTTWIGVITGFIGVLLLLWPNTGFISKDFIWQLLLIIPCLSWAFSSVYLRKSQIKTPIIMFTALSMLVGSSELAIVGTLTEQWSHLEWTTSIVMCMAFVVLISGSLAHLCYYYLARNVSPALLSSYAYINPLVAVASGYLLLNETLSFMQLISMIIILLGLFLVTKNKGIN
jgi:drug/metabolite transporter (DMT)-like permease